MIKFNKPFYNKDFKSFINKEFGKFELVGNSKYTRRAEKILEKIYTKSTVHLTTSCTHALEISAMLLNIKANDEVLLPSYTFSSTANAFLLRGAKIKFVDSSNTSPNISIDDLESKITNKTKCLVIVHYGGAACDMDKILFLKNKYNFYLVEDAAQAIGSKYKNKPLGTFGEIGCISFHDTKNISCGEGGAIILNKKKFIKRSEIIREKGTNRTDFIKGKINKYNWVDIGSSYIPSDLLSILLIYQLKHLYFINKLRIKNFNTYLKSFQKYFIENLVIIPNIPRVNYHNAHIFYLIFKSEKICTKFISYMKKNKIEVYKHYEALENSYINNFPTNQKKITCQNSYKISKCLVRLPIHSSLKNNEINKIISKSKKFLECLK